MASVNLLRINFEYTTTAYIAHRIKKYITPRMLIEEIDSQPEQPPPVPKGKIKLNVRANPSAQPRPATTATQIMPGTSPAMKQFTTLKTATGSQVVLKLKSNSSSPSFPMHLIQNADGGLKGDTTIGNLCTCYLKSMLLFSCASFSNAFGSIIWLCWWYSCSQNNPTTRHHFPSTRANG